MYRKNNLDLIREYQCLIQWDKSWKLMRGLVLISDFDIYIENSEFIPTILPTFCFHFKSTIAFICFCMIQMFCREKKKTSRACFNYFTLSLKIGVIIKAAFTFLFSSCSVFILFLLLENILVRLTHN